MRQEPKNSGNALEDGIETESRLQLIVDTTPALIYSARPDGYIDFFNQHCLEFGGGPRRFMPTILKHFWPGGARHQIALNHSTTVRIYF